MEGLCPGLGGWPYAMKKRNSRFWAPSYGVPEPWKANFVPRMSAKGFGGTQRLHYICRPLSGNKSKDEKDIPTFRTETPQQARLPQAHGNGSRPQRAQLTPPQRPQEALGQHRAPSQGRRAPLTEHLDSKKRDPWVPFFVPKGIHCKKTKGQSEAGRDQTNNNPGLVRRAPPCQGLPLTAPWMVPSNSWMAWMERSFLKSNRGPWPLNMASLEAHTQGSSSTNSPHSFADMMRGATVGIRGSWVSTRSKPPVVSFSQIPTTAHVMPSSEVW